MSVFFVCTADVFKPSETCIISLDPLLGLNATFLDLLYKYELEMQNNPKLLGNWLLVNNKIT